MQKNNILIFIPTYNDSEVLGYLIDEIKTKLPHAVVLVVDDGSELPIEIYKRVLKVRIPFNLGLGVATHVALDYATNHQFEIIVRMDADGQHKVDDVERLVSRLLEQDEDIIIGRRENRNDSYAADSILRRMSRAYINIIVRLALRKKIPADLNTGFIAMNRKSMIFVNTLELERYPEPQILLHTLSHGLKIGEVEVEQNIRKHGKSTIKSISGIVLLFRVTMYCLLILTGPRAK